MRTSIRAVLDTYSVFGLQIGGTFVITTIALAFSKSLRDLPLGWQVLFVIGVLVLLISLSVVIVKWLGGRKHQLAVAAAPTAEPRGGIEVVSPTPAAEPSQVRIPAWAKGLVADQKMNFERSVVVLGYETNVSHILILNGHIEFHFDVFNGTIFRVRILRDIEGYITYQGEESTDAPRIAWATVSFLTDGHSPGARGQFKLRQPLRENVQAHLRARAGQQVEFGLGNMHIRMEGVPPDDSINVMGALQLPDSILVQLPSSMEMGGLFSD